jgi:hypothetical protein
VTLPYGEFAAVPKQQLAVEQSRGKAIADTQRFAIERIHRNAFYSSISLRLCVEAEHVQSTTLDASSNL